MDGIVISPSIVCSEVSVAGFFGLLTIVLIACHVRRITRTVFSGVCAALFEKLFSDTKSDFCISQSGPCTVFFCENRLPFQGPGNSKLRIVPCDAALVSWGVVIGGFIEKFRRVA